MKNLNVKQIVSYGVVVGGGLLVLNSVIGGTRAFGSGKIPSIMTFVALFTGIAATTQAINDLKKPTETTV